MSTRVTKLHDGKYFHMVTIRTEGEYIYLETPFALKDEVKAMQGARWMGYDPVKPEKVWRVNNSTRNRFTLDYMEGKPVYARYKKELKDGNGFKIRYTRKNQYGEECKIRDHQIEMTLHMLVRRQCIVAGEMGVGKTLAAIEAMELSLVPEVWYAAPKSALTSVIAECRNWRCLANVKFMTYDELKGKLARWVDGTPPPKMVVFDESSRIKTASAQRSQAAMYLAEAIRAHWGDDGYIIEMSGSPAPKSPTDWWHQCEVARPGYIKEGDIWKFNARLAVMAQQQDGSGVKYNKLVAWRDGDPETCDTCGQSKSSPCHSANWYGDTHQFVPMSNEVEKLYKRMSGLVYVKLKKDCLDLPDKIYRVVRLKPSLDLLRAAKIVQATCKTSIQSLTLMRELSDGFQYQGVVETETCKGCNGSGERDDTICNYCSGSGLQKYTDRKVVEVDSPKLAAVTDLLDENEEIGRIVLYAGFTASIDRACAHVKKQGWEFVRIDGRGWSNSINPNWNSDEAYAEFQNKKSKVDKLAIVAHPASAGMGLTLTRASMEVYISNDFNGESRIQSEDRIHRMSMDVNRGATIVDLILLPTDEKVLDSHKKKQKLQSISMGEIASTLDNFKWNEVT